MSIDRVGNITSTAFAVDIQEAKKHTGPAKETYCGDVVSIGKGDAISALQIKWPPLFPIGHTQTIYEMDE